MAESIIVKLEKRAVRASGGTGIRVGLKNLWEQSLEGSIPSSPTILLEQAT